MSEEKILYMYFSDGLLMNKPRKAKPSVSGVKCIMSDDCPLYKKGQCIASNQFEKCMYGYRFRNTCTNTMASTKGRKWAKEQKQLAEKYPNPLNSASKCITIIGDYVWLPYSFMTMCESVPFDRHSSIILSGVPFVKLEDFTIETIKTLVNFSPRSLMGGVITQYRDEILPIFLLHLQLVLPDMYNEFISKYPSAKEIVKNVDLGKKINAKLSYVPYGYTGFTYKGMQCQSWDGERLVVKGVSDKILFFTFGVDDTKEMTLDVAIGDASKVEIVIHDSELIKDIVVNNPEVLQ